MQTSSDVSPLLAKDRWARVLEQPAAKPPSMRVFGLIMLVGFGILGGLLLLGWHRAGQPAGSWRFVIGAVLVSAGALLFVWSLIAPGSLPPVYRGWMAFGQKLGTIVSTVLLTAAYFLVVTPVGLLMRLTGTDPLERRIERGKGSYWQDHAGPRSADGYTHMS